MFKSFQIKLFQSHRDTKLLFSPGVNTIIGKSTTGKTAIIRAFKKIIENRPLGFRFNSNFEDKGRNTELILEADNCTISLKKDKNNLTYKLGKKEWTDLSDLVVKSLNISELNIQSQLDPPFLITSTAGEVTKTINRITGQDIIDSWIAECNSRIRGNKKEITKEILNNKDIKNKLKKYIGLDKVKIFLDKLSIIDKDYNSNKEILESIEVIVNDITSCQAKIDKYKSIKEVDSDLNTLLGIDDEAEELQKELDIISKYLEVQEYYDEILAIYNEAVKELKPLSDELKGVESDIVSLEEELKLIEKLFVVESSIGVNKQKLEKEIEKYKIRLKEIGKCPFCISDINGKAIDRIIRGIK